MKVQRKPTEADTELQFQFNEPGVRFLVKNFTDDDIYVGVEAGTEKDNMILIPTEAAQVIPSADALGCDTVYVIPVSASDKGVEVQCLR